MYKISDGLFGCAHLIPFSPFSPSSSLKDVKSLNVFKGQPPISRIIYMADLKSLILSISAILSIVISRLGKAFLLLHNLQLIGLSN